MELKRNYHLRLQDEQKLGELAKQDPNLVLPEIRPQFTPEFFKEIGETYEPKVLGKGYIRLLWQDFIVEEITSDASIINISPQEEPHLEDFNPEKPKTETDMVKQGIPTIEAIERLAEALNLEFKNINYNGLKDAGALTAQQISFNGIRPAALANLSIPNLFLKNLHERKGVAEVGNIFGNRFTILVRSSQVDKKVLKQKVQELNERGFLNFYSLQRFGNRFISHKLGKLVLQGKYQDAVRLMLIGDSINEMTIFRNLRKEASQYWGNWAKISEIFNEFPFFLYYELVALESLKASSIGFVKALSAIQEQTKLFVYAYFSFLFNKLLSMSAVDISPELPLFRDYPEIKSLYEKTLPPDDLSGLLFQHRGLEFLNLSRRQLVKTRMIPKIWHVLETPVGYIFHFDLEKGAYATTLLSEFFELYQGKPVPEWVPQASFDSRMPLGYPPVQETIDKFPKAQEKTDLNLIE